jgi:CRISPR/Cas system endoribonuclease Cas6 (RAMP superfamily)
LEKPRAASIITAFIKKGKKTFTQATITLLKKISRLVKGIVESTSRVFFRFSSPKSSAAAAIGIKIITTGSIPVNLLNIRIRDSLI